MLSLATSTKARLLQTASSSITTAHLPKPHTLLPSKVQSDPSLSVQQPSYPKTSASGLLMHSLSRKSRLTALAVVSERQALRLLLTQEALRLAVQRQRRPLAVQAIPLHLPPAQALAPRVLLVLVLARQALQVLRTPLLVVPQTPRARSRSAMATSSHAQPILEEQH
jgi:hypothetical protein